MKVYIFFRSNGWYPLQFQSDEEAIANAEANPGTVKVETAKGKVVWRRKLQ